MAGRDRALPAPAPGHGIPGLVQDRGGAPSTPTVRSGWEACSMHLQKGAGPRLDRAVTVGCKSLVHLQKTAASPTPRQTTHVPPAPAGLAYLPEKTGVFQSASPDAALQRAPGVLSHFHVIPVTPGGVTPASVRGRPCSSPSNNSAVLLLRPYSSLSPASPCLLSIIFTSALTTARQEKYYFRVGQKRWWCPCWRSSRHCHCQLLQLFLLASQHRFHPVWLKPPPSRASSGGRATEARAGRLLRTLSYP